MTLVLSSLHGMSLQTVRLIEPLPTIETGQHPPHLPLDELVKTRENEGWSLDHLTTVLVEDIHPNRVPIMNRLLVHTLVFSINADI